MLFMHREANKEILHTVRDVNTDVKNVYAGVNVLKEQTNIGVNQVSAGIAEIKKGVKDGQNQGATQNDLISAGIERVLAGVGQVSMSVDDAQVQAKDGFERVQSGVQNLEKHLSKEFDTLAANIDSVNPYIKKVTAEITEAMQNHHGQALNVLSQIGERQEGFKGQEKGISSLPATCISLSSNFNELVVLAQDDHAFFKWLSPLTSDFENKQSEIINVEARQEGIGAWLFETEKYQTWFRGPPTILWCFGDRTYTSILAAES